MKKLSEKILIPLFLVVFFILAIDYLVFGFLIWKLPNESPWGTNHFFNFVYEYKRLLQEEKKNPRILITGSSIAYYSLDRDLLKKFILENSGKNVDPEYFSYAGMTPLDAFLSFEKIRSLHPDLIVLPLNFIDLRLHRTYSLNQSQKNSTVPDSEIILDALDYSEAPQSKFAFPVETVREFHSALGTDQNAFYLASGLFGFFRYREIYLQNLKNIYNHRFGRNTSYHGYAGVQIPERVSSLGWTGKKFSFFPTGKIRREGFYLQIVPEILKHGPLKIVFRNKSGMIQEFEFVKPEWAHIVLKEEFFQPKISVTAELSATWRPCNASEERFDHQREEMGVRLQQTFGLDVPAQNMHYTREERSEDVRYANMPEKEYREYFQYRLLSDLEHRPGIAYLHALKVAKERIAQEEFVPTLHLRYLKQFAEMAARHKIKILLINNPESPISLGW
ncbi:MAG: hypothetical protein K8R21_05635, partial [Leptospira sp.]|nr:hypothetical protein [Leptospira sp.]